MTKLMSQSNWILLKNLIFIFSCPATPPFLCSVDEGFDKHDIPYDVLWLDIEHTDGKRYLTWDTAKFPTSDVMQNNLAAKGRKVGASMATVYPTERTAES